MRGEDINIDKKIIVEQEEIIKDLKKEIAKYKPVCYRTDNNTTGFYRYHLNEPVGLVYTTLYSKED